MDVIGFFGDGVRELVGNLRHMPVGEAIIFDIALILIVSAILAFVAKLMRQPLIPAYVVAGVVVGPLVLGFVKNMDLIYAFSEIGIAFLLFIAGLEISFRKIKEVGLKKIIFVGFLQVAIIFGIVLFSSSFLNLNYLQACYIGIILAFGSTMVDIKLLADKGELVTLHGRLVLGILLLQDLIAIIAIIVFTAGGFDVSLIATSFAYLVVIFIVAIVMQRFIFNAWFKFAARSNELLFLSALAVLFFFIILAYFFELSIVIGAFIAGVSLANSPFKTELESRVSPLRDFFAVLFFVSLGTQLVFNGIGSLWVLLVVLLVGAFILKPIVTFVLLRTAGYHSRTSFLTSISLAQLSEFSLIIGAIGVSTGALDLNIFSVVVFATIITMSVTPYFIDYKNWLHGVFSFFIGLFGFFPKNEKINYNVDGDKEILLVGSHRTGGALMEELLSKKDKLLVVDHNPEIINVLKNKGISCVYGDITSPEFLEKINVRNFKLAISTVPDYEGNLHFLRKIKKISPMTKVVVTGQRISEALNLYKKGADYVVTPKIVAGQELAGIIHGKRLNLGDAKKKHLKYLKEIHRLLY